MRLPLVACHRLEGDYNRLSDVQCVFEHNTYPGSKVHGANMGHTWVLSAPGGPHVGPMNLAIRVMSPYTRIVVF